PVAEVIRVRAETSIFVALFSMIIIILIGISIGVLSALKYNSFLDQFFMGIAMFGAAIPTFWSGLILMLLFAVNLKWLPTSGFPGVLQTGNLSNFRYLVMPCVALAIPNAALIIRLTRSTMLDVAKEDYVRTAKAKGLTNTKVNIKHILRNALIPVLSALGFTFVGLMSGAVVTENVFALPGLGQLIVQSILRRDYPVIQGIVLFVVLAYMAVNLLIDISFAYLDPRIRYN
ncbi:MAG: ABC transporter permease, partial [Atribacterota bacterium]|nr:ABC transporter permease [Atribacterota bacterium]